MAAWNPKANEIFLAVIELDSDLARRVHLDQACAGDAELRGQVEALLKAHDEQGGMLDKPADELPMTAAFRPAAEQVGSVIGPYKLRQKLGEGGMGTVFMAEQQEPVRRQVALKIIKAGMDSAQVIARF